MIKGYGLIDLKALKTGGQKEVFSANCQQFGKVVYKKGKCHATTSLARIKQEVTILRDINSCYFPKIHAFSSDSDGTFEILEQFISPYNLSDAKSEFTTERDICKLIVEIIQGMSILWNKRIVHRDLKPDNILITKDLKPVIIDLGIARVLDDKSLTRTIYAQGPATPVFAAPEQLMNRKSSISMRTDFFQLGIIMFVLLTGHHPYDPKLVGSGMSIMENIINGNYNLIVPAMAISDEFKQILIKLLADQPFKRYRTYSQFVNDLIKIC